MIVGVVGKLAAAIEGSCNARAITWRRHTDRGGVLRALGAVVGDLQGLRCREPGCWRHSFCDGPPPGHWQIGPQEDSAFIPPHQHRARKTVEISPPGLTVGRRRQYFYGRVAKGARRALRQQPFAGWIGTPDVVDPVQHARRGPCIEHEACILTTPPILLGRREHIRAAHGTARSPDVQELVEAVDVIVVGMR